MSTWQRLNQVGSSLLTAVALGLLTPHASAEPVVSFGTGVNLSIGAGFLGAPERRDLLLPKSGERFEYPDFHGFSYGAGVFAEARALGLVGLELSLSYHRDRLLGRAKRAGSEVEIDIRQPSFRGGLFAKGILPLGLLAPFVIAGPEYELPGLSTLEVKPASAIGAVASADPALFWVFGGGVELSIPGLPLYVPVSLRVRYNPSVSDVLEERALALPSDALVFQSSASYSLNLVSGLGVEF